MAKGTAVGAGAELDLEDLPPASEREQNSQKVAAREFARAIGARRRESGAPVWTIFVSDPSVPRPPLARLLSGSTRAGGGGRGGQLRVELYLSLIWVCARQLPATRPQLGRAARA